MALFLTEEETEAQRSEVSCLLVELSEVYIVLKPSSPAPELLGLIAILPFVYML